MILTRLLWETTGLQLPVHLRFILQYDFTLRKDTEASVLENVELHT